ncbi:MAG: aminopeptidase P family protein [Chlorobi bacterium]|nr:aminopeptidase P family protein [Chlorobiota bacterium]
MFRPETYAERRKELKKILGGGLLLIPGNDDVAFNYPANTYKFRQDSSFLYYFGLDAPGLFGIIDVDNDKDILFGNDREVEDVVWMGPEPPLSERALKCGVNETHPFAEVEKYISSAKSKNQIVHYLPQYRAEKIIQLSDLLGVRHNTIAGGVSQDFVKAVIIQRSLKTEEELSEIERALDISYVMNTTAMKLIQPGLIEREIYGIVEGITLSYGAGVSFPVIFSVRGETLHNHHHENALKEGDIAVLDSGAESALHYASDITRTIPVSGKFSPLQRDVYNTVLRSQTEAIEMMKPGIKYKEIHLRAAKIITEGLIDLGLMKGNPDDAVAAGAHALFFPHGLGHLMGLDVHDLEGLGETLAGYDAETQRSDQFGLAYLRYGKKLETGLVLTAEPGIYFIPQLIRNWEVEKKNEEFINFGKAEAMIGFGGIRIEDDVVITENGHRVLGRPIPKTVEEIEEVCNS